MTSPRDKTALISLLDKKKIDEEKTSWQMINLLLPSGFIILFAIIYGYIKKRKYQAA